MVITHVQAEALAEQRKVTASLLDQRNAQILALAAQGIDAQAIAARSGVSAQTVRAVKRAAK